MEIFASIGWTLGISATVACVWLYTRLQRAEQALTDAQQRYGSLEDKARRAQEETDGVLQRLRSQTRTQLKFAHEPLLKALIPVVDNFERALSTAPEQDSPTLTGVRMIHTQLLRGLQSHGVTAVDVVGQTFDPALHEAVDIRPTADAPENTVVMQWGRAFRLHDRVIRPAQVVVAAPPEPQPQLGDSPDELDVPPTEEVLRPDMLASAPPREE